MMRPATPHPAARNRNVQNLPPLYIEYPTDDD